MRKGWIEDDYGFARVVADWLPLAVSPRCTQTAGVKDEWWAASIDGQRLTDGRGNELRFKDADLAMRGVEEELAKRLAAAAAELAEGGAA